MTSLAFLVAVISRLPPPRSKKTEEERSIASAAPRKEKSASSFPERTLKAKPVSFLDPLHELHAVLRFSEGAGCDGQHTVQAFRTHYLPVEAKGLDGATHGLLAQPSGRAQPFTQLRHRAVLIVCFKGTAVGDSID